MKKTLLSLAFIANVACSQSFIRTHTIVSDNSTFPTPANVEWMQGESVQFQITAKYGNFYIGLSNGATPVLKMWSGNVITQLYAQKTGTIYSAGSGKLYVDLLANEANISPSGAYNYAVGVYDGTQYMGVVAQGRATVRAHPFGASVGYVGAFNAFPYVPTNDANYLGGITGAVAGANVSIARTGRTVYISATAGGGGSGTFTNLQWGTNNNTAQALIRAESNIVFRSAGGTNYAALAENLTGDFTFNGAINANDNIEIANMKHLRFQDGGGTNTVHLAATAGRLIVTGAVDIVTGQAVPATINGSRIATGTPIYVQSETNASARLASNVWAAADSTTNYVRRTGGSYTATGGWEFIAGGLSNNLRLKAGDSLGQGGDLILAAGDADSGGDIKIYSGLGDSGPGDIILGIHDDTNPFLILSNTNGATFYLPVSGDGSGLTGLNGASITNLSAFSTVATNGSGNVVTNLTFGGSVITQQMGTVSGGGEPSVVAVPLNWGSFRSLTTNSSVLPVFGFVGGDSLTATSALSMLSFVVSATNTAQEKFAVSDLSWPVNSATGITVTFNFQTAANGMSLAFYNGISNAVTYNIPATAGTFTTNLTAAGFLTSAAQGAWVQVACFSTNISTNAANTVANGIGRVLRVSK